jgi:hypothetical protein
MSHYKIEDDLAKRVAARMQKKAQIQQTFVYSDPDTGAQLTLLTDGNNAVLIADDQRVEEVGDTSTLREGEPQSVSMEEFDTQLQQALGKSFNEIVDLYGVDIGYGAGKVVAVYESPDQAYWLWSFDNEVLSLFGEGGAQDPIHDFNWPIGPGEIKAMEEWDGQPQPMTQRHIDMIKAAIGIDLGKQS